MSIQKLSSFEQACTLIGADSSIPAKPDEKAHVIFLAACKLLGKDPGALPDLGYIDTDFQPSIIAFYKLQVIRKAVVGDWVADWSRQQRKWAPYFWMNDPGFRLGDVVYGFASAHWSGGSRLCFETEEQAEFVGTDCIALYRDLFGAGSLAA